jgi:DNA polymerase I-like protein with 3'-5' exonuclease and polymerase domains
VDRTGELLDFILPTFDAKMMEAYRRELKLMPILLKNEQEGMRVDVEALRSDIAIYQKALERADLWLRTPLHAPSLNLDADADVAAALKANDLITEWTKTPTGRDSVSKKYLTNDKFRDQQVAGALGYRNRLTTVLSMSMLPWLEEADRHGGVISTTWNQVRQSHGDESKSGTRSGRLSCSRFQNISKDFDDKDDGYVHPKFLRVPPLPLVRKYILPDKGQSFGHRDYKQQELRILAHFEDGALCSAYNSDPDLDVHAYVQGLILQILNMELSRRPVKIMNFLQVYGGGVPAIMEKLKCSRAQAEQLRRAHKAALPGVEILNRQIKAMASEGQPIRTWGGRLYYVEEPKFVNGRLMDFYYKLLNYLIQGSAADCTKEALIRYAAADKEARFLVTVHDEINFSAPEKAMKKEMKILNDVMASVEFDVPMLSDGKVGPNWGSLKKFVD